MLNIDTQILKVLILGTKDSGKTLLANKFAHKTVQKLSPTIGFNLISTKIIVNEHIQVKLQVLDTSGEQKYKVFIINNTLPSQLFNLICRWLHVH
jgi:small GTP-binding protein